MPKRKIVKIDESKCDGCGLCVPACAEGAIRIIDGKARLLKDNYCDGLGACLGDCPQGAISIEEREAAAFDEAAVQAHLKLFQMPPATTTPAGHGCQGSCPGTRMRRLEPAAPVAKSNVDERPSRLGQWPVQIHLLPIEGDIWTDADVLIAADCAPFAMPDFHERLLAGKTLAIGCPKLDDLNAYIEKFSAIFSRNPIRSVTVAHMQVPCCNGILMAARQLLVLAGRSDIEFHDIVIGIKGEVLSES